MQHPILDDLNNVVSTHRVIGLLVSGGLDSALLAYLLHNARRRLNTKNVFEFITMPGADRAVVHASNIRNWIDERFNQGRPSTAHTLGDPALHHSQRVTSSLLEALNVLPYLDVVLNAANITPLELPDGPIRRNSLNPKVYLPFFPYTKDVLVKLCIDLELTELMKLAHTCTESRSIRCTECWQCRERAWAFKQNNYLDPGEL